MTNWILLFSLLTPDALEDYATGLWNAGDEARPTALDTMLAKFDDEYEAELAFERERG
jgi:hypothetical protein